jgi:hypothetical protein
MMRAQPFESAWTKLGNVGKGDAVIDTAVKSVWLCLFGPRCFVVRVCDCLLLFRAAASS